MASNVGRSPLYETVVDDGTRRGDRAVPGPLAGYFGCGGYSEAALILLSKRSIRDWRFSFCCS